MKIEAEAKGGAAAASRVVEKSPHAKEVSTQTVPVVSWP